MTMTESGSRCCLSIAVLVIASLSGCQSIRGQQAADLHHSSNDIRIVKSEQPAESRGAVVTLSRQLETDPSDEVSGGSKKSLWSRIQSPTRFLLPRTDTAEGAVLEEEQGLDDGF